MDVLLSKFTTYHFSTKLEVCRTSVNMAHALEETIACTAAAFFVHSYVPGKPHLLYTCYRQLRCCSPLEEI